MSRIRYAAIGTLAAVAGLAAGHLVAGFVQPAASPVLAMGSTAIDLTPTPVKEWAVSRFGTADKPILVGSVLLVILVATALVGLLARTHLVAAASLTVAFTAVAGAAALTRPAAGPLDVLPAVATSAVGVALLVRLSQLATPERWPAVVPKGMAPRPGRRTFLGAALGVGALSTLAAVGGQLRSAAKSARDLVLPRPADPAAPLPAGLETSVLGVSPLRTPTDAFYRVDTNLVVPRVDVDAWRLEVDGMVESPYSLTFQELSALPLLERDITLTCVSNEVGGGYVGAARWLGVRLTDLLDRAGVRGRPDQVLSTAVDGFAVSTPIAAVRDGRDAMVAIGMNGAPLPDSHGFPARLVTPGLYGFVGATKWLTRLTLTTYAEQQAYWTRRQWATDAPIKTSARIDTPTPLSTVERGRIAIGGVAWAQHRGIGRVEVRVDDGGWHDARLGADVGVDYWRQWWLPWDAEPGLHRLAVRATDRAGCVQTSERARPFPDGASGIQEVVVTVA